MASKVVTPRAKRQPPQIKLDKPATGRDISKFLQPNLINKDLKSEFLAEEKPSILQSLSKKTDLVKTRKKCGTLAHQKFSHLILPDNKKDSDGGDENLEIKDSKATKFNDPEISSSTRRPAIQQRKGVGLTSPVSKETMALVERAKVIEEKRKQRKLAHQKFDYLTKDETSSSKASPEKHLPLPLTYNNLYQIFKSCDTAVSMLHNRREVISFDKLKSSVEKIVRKNFTEEILNKILEVYPGCYFLRYEKEFDKLSKKHTGDYVIIVQPNLRSDDTEIGLQSPSKGHIVFTGSRLGQRKDEFHSKLINRVYGAHKEFLLSLGIKAQELPPNEALKRWHPKFKLDSMDILPTKSRLPMSPAKLERRITTAKEAVQVFRARALFRAADICENISSKADVKGEDKSQINLVKANEQTPVMDMLSKMVENVSGEQTGGDLIVSRPSLVQSPVKPPASALVGVSNSLLAKIRAKEEQRRLLTLTKKPISAKRDAMLSRIPDLVTQLYLLLRSSNGKPIPWSTVAKSMSVSCKSGTMSTESAVEHIKVIFEFQPSDWLENLEWKTPYLRAKNCSLELKFILDEIKKKVDKERFG